MPAFYKTSHYYSSGECLTNLPVAQSNLIKLYTMASQAEIRKGMAWYSDAKQDAIDIAQLYDVDIVTVVKVACALSPKMPWDVNMAAASWVIRHYQAGCFVPDIDDYRTGKVYLSRTPKSDPNKPALTEDDRILSTPYGGLKQSVIKALWILQGHDWVLRGKKVNAFCDNILHADTSTLVTIDSHAIQCWFGQVAGGTYRIPDSFWQIVAADYQYVAKLLKIAVSQLQAIVWLVKKRLSKIKGAVAKFLNNKVK